MAMDAAMLKSLIRQGIPDAQVEVADLRGDGEHYAATVTSTHFAGKTRIEQHKMVFQTLQGRIGDELHALQLTTRTA